MRKVLILSLLAIFIALGAGAQSFFKPLPKQTFNGKLKLSLDSIISGFRPVAVLAANVSNGAQLAGGAGVGYQINKWDNATQAYITKYSFSAVGLLGTTGSKLTGTAGIVTSIPGTNGLIGVGGGRDFTQGQWVLLTGVLIKFN